MILATVTTWIAWALLMLARTEFDKLNAGEHRIRQAQRG
jgi:hypothetical protein